MATPNSGIKHWKLEECEYFQISSRPNTQYETTLPQNSHKAHYTRTWNENGAKWIGRISLLENVDHSHSCVCNIIKVLSKLNQWCNLPYACQDSQILYH